MTLFHAAQHQGRRKQLRQPVEVERRVGSRGEQTGDVLLAERLLPGNPVVVDDRRGETRNASLDAQ